MRDLVVLGTGGLGRETHEAAIAAGRKVVGFLDDNPASVGKRFHDLPVLGNAEWLRDHPNVEVSIAIGAPASRARVRARLDALGHRKFATIIDPRAAVGQRVTIGEGSIVLQSASLTTDIRVGRHVVINPGALIAHDDVLEDFVLVAPGAAVSGNVRVEMGADIGTNSAILQGLRIGAWSIIGGGAVVREDVPANTTVVGVPARVVKTRPNDWQSHL